MEVNKDLLDKYYRGECSTKEVELVESWLQEREWPIEHYLPAPGEDMLPADWAFPTKLERGRKFIKHHFPVLITTLVVIFAGSWGGLSLMKSNIEQQGHRIYETGFGEIRKVILDDSTTVILNSKSKLQAPISFGKKSREILLEGEAFLDVSKDGKRPFIIHTENNTVRVLGTSFNLKAYPNEDTELVVSTGKVELSSKKSTREHAVLSKGERAIFHPGSKRIDKESVKVDVAVAWINHEIIVNNEPLHKIIPVLERNYGVKFTGAGLNRLSDRFYSGYHNQSSLEKVLENMAYVMNFEYEIKGNTINIK